MSRDDKARRELYPLIAEAIEKGYADIGCGFDISVAQAITPNIYNALIREGYRKSTELAEEIFAEIEKNLNNSVETEHFKGSWFNMNKFRQRLAELKKKYTENKGE